MALRDFPFLSRMLPNQTAAILSHFGFYEQAVLALAWAQRPTRSVKQAYWLVSALFELGKFEDARRLVIRHSTGMNQSPHILHLRAQLELIAGNETKALELANAAKVGWPWLRCPHQNMAARYSNEYVATRLDYEAGDLGTLFDLANLTAQRVTHVGSGEIASHLFGIALEKQRQLRANVPSLSAELHEWLVKHQIRLDDLAIIPIEWVTQIGHMGMIDILFRMRALGWWRGKAVLLATPDKIANRPMINLFSNECYVAISPESMEPSLWADLFSLQRYYGINFNVFSFPDGAVVPWQEAGALAIQKWETEKRGHPLRDQFDERYGDTLRHNLERIKALWGMQPGDWFVCLHVRGSGFYREADGQGQTHRNATVSPYVAAIKFVTQQGGWVVQVGAGDDSQIFPPFERFVDYSRSAYRSAAIDLQLIREARYFIGTTSGLTNVAVSLGVPCALVNCITVDAQLWGQWVRFALKPIRDRENKMVTQRQLTETPRRWQVFSADTLRNHGLSPAENTSDEVLETVKEVHALASHSSLDLVKPEEEIIARWRASLAFSHYYGNARPSIYCMQKWQKEFLPESEQIFPSSKDGTEEYSDVQSVRTVS